MAAVTQLRFVSHCVFGIGAVLAERLTDSGAAADTWFVDSGTVRTMLAESLTEAPRPKLSKEQARALRHAVAEYKKSHRQRARRTAADKPRMKRAFRDRIFKAEWRHIDCGDDPTAADADEGLAAVHLGSRNVSPQISLILALP